MFSCFHLLLAFGIGHKDSSVQREHACLLNLSIAELLKDSLGHLKPFEVNVCHIVCITLVMFLFWFISPKFLSSVILQKVLNVTHETTDHTLKCNWFLLMEQNRRQVFSPPKKVSKK